MNNDGVLLIKKKSFKLLKQFDDDKLRIEAFLVDIGRNIVTNTG